MTERNTTPPSSIQVIQVQSRFARMARREGGIAAKDAIAAAEAFVEGQRGRYFDWVAEDLDLLDRMLGQIHAGGGRDAIQDEAAYFKVAQIRDLGGTFGYQVITEVAECFCELLYRLKSASLYSRDAIETHHAALKLVCDRDFAAMPAATGPTLLRGLHQVIDKFPAPLPPADSKPSEE